MPFVSPTDTIRDTMVAIGKGSRGVALVVDEETCLLGMVTDGDVRRALLRNPDLNSSIQEVMNRNPIVASENMSERDLISLMRVNKVRHLPVVDRVGRVISLEYRSVTGVSDTTVKTAVVMAGGEGKRLRPLTDSLPKPMLPVGGRPLLEILLTSLRDSDFRRILVSVGYLGDRIQEYFGDGSSCGVEIHYLVEKEPLGTAGALRMIPQELTPGSPFLVLNGDLLTRLRLETFRDFHLAAGYELSLCCRPYEVEVPFGYPVLDGDLVVDFREKPTFHYLVNSGIYCLSPSILGDLPEEAAFNMTDLIHRSCTSGRRVGVFPLREPYHEIGQEDSYLAAEGFYQEHFGSADDGPAVWGEPCGP